MVWSVPLLENGTIPARFLPQSWSPLTVGVGFVVPTWGAAPQIGVSGAAATLRGHIERGVADILPGAVLATGTFTAGLLIVAQSSTGAVLLTTSATQLSVVEVLTGAAPEWVSLDGLPA